MTDSAPDMLDQYVQGIELLDKELHACFEKAKQLNILADKLICTTPPPDRNKCLHAFAVVKSCLTTNGDSRTKKQLSATKTKIQNVILGMLASEELDNFSHNGKMFYPSSTTRFNVADRVALEQWILQQLQSDPSMLSMFGNTLNTELIKALQEKNQIDHVDQETGEITKIDGPPPPGVGLHTTTTLNMRSKK